MNKAKFFPKLPFGLWISKLFCLFQHFVYDQTRSHLTLQIWLTSNYYIIPAEHIKVTISLKS